MTIQRTTHPDYDEQYKYVLRADDVYYDRIKDKGSMYLPIAGSMPADGSEATTAFNNYKLHKYSTTTLPMAVFYNFSNLSLGGYIGAIMRKPPMIKFNEGDDDSVLDYMIDNVDGKGNGLTQVARKALVSQYLKGRAGYLVSVPAMGNLAEVTTGVKVPRIVPFDSQNILDWDTDYRDGVEVLTSLLLTENARARTNGQLCDEERLIKYMLTAEGVTYEITKGDETESGTLMKAGKAATTIPFHYAGSVNNDWTQDPAPMRTLIDLNLQHYLMYNRDMQGRWDLAELQLHIDVGTSSDPAGEFKSLNPMGVISDSSVPILTANGGSATYLQANESDLLAAAPERILEMAVKAGAQLFSDSGSNETAKAAGMRASNSTATMSTIASNNGDALYNAIIDAAGYFGDIGGINTDEIMFSLNTEFIESSLDAQQLTAYSAMVMQGILPVRAMYDILRKSGDIAEDMTFQDYQDMLLEDKQGAMPDVSGTTNLPTDN